MKILFADDSATMRKVAEITLATDDYDLVLLPSGAEVLEGVKSNAPDVVVLDGDMPSVDGYDACKQLRDDPATKGVPVLLLSGPSKPYDEQRAQSVGVTEHMDKPFETQSFYDKLKALSSAPAAEAPQPSAAASPKPPTPDKGAPRPKVGSKTVVGLGAMGLAPNKPGAAPAPAAGQKPPAAGQKPPAAASPGLSQPKSAPKAIPKPGGAPSSSKPGPIASPVGSKPAGKIPPAPKPAEKPAGKPASTGASLADLSKLGDADKPVEQRAAELSPEQVEAIRVVAREVIEHVVWEVVPDLAETIIKEELAKLLKE